MHNLEKNRPVIYARVTEYLNRNAEIHTLQQSQRETYLETCFEFVEACLEYWDTATGRELVGATVQLTEVLWQFDTPLNVDDFYCFTLQAIDDEECNTPEHKAYELQGKIHAYGFSGRVEGLGGQLYGVVFDLPNDLHAVLTEEVLTINKGELLEGEIDRLQLDALEHLEMSERLRLASIVLNYYNNPQK